MSRVSGIAIMAIVIGWTVFNHKPWHQPIAWDAFGYYLYLPATIIHQDPAIKDPEWFNALFTKYEPAPTVYHFNYMEDGGRAIKYPIGLSILWVPFFVAAHAIAPVMDQPADGLSSPYQWAMVIASWTYLLIGLSWLRKLLLRYFTDRVTALSLVILVLGTNITYMTVFDPLMPHMFLFSLYAGIMWYSDRWHRDRKAWYAFMIGLLCGLAMAVRNTEFIAFIIPLLWGLRSWRDQCVKFKIHARHIMIAAVTSLIIVLPQFIYWKLVTGSFFYVSYTNAGEGLDLLRPHVFEVLFSFRKGLLIYTPVIVIAVFGLIYLHRHARTAIPAIPVYLLVNFWIVSSWTIWWYADSFSNRGFVQSYAAMALPLAALTAQIMTSRFRFHVAFAVILLTGLCLFQTWQSSAGILHTSRMTRSAYFKGLGRTEKVPGIEDHLVVQRNYDGTVNEPDLSRYKEVYRAQQHFDRPEAEFPADHYRDPYALRGRSYRVDAQVPWSAASGRAFGELTDRDHIYAHYKINVFIPQDIPHPDAVIVIAMEHKARKYGELLREINAAELVPGKWNTIEVWYVSPPVRHPADLLRAYVWLRGGDAVWVDEAELIVYEPK
jgi:hypothetical protein